ncbi:MAG: hypothetical protein JO166_17480 [Deltaproteobacteria bacterium]|nr:hypothetical protein [Deltaproteobacteria bacterium]
MVSEILPALEDDIGRRLSRGGAFATDHLYGRNKPVSAAGNRLYKSGVIGVIVERGPQLF